jgi:hypothetical protein
VDWVKYVKMENQAAVTKSGFSVFLSLTWDGETGKLGDLDKCNILEKL